MATPIGHYLVGISLAGLVATNERHRREAPWWATFAWAPDLDVLPGLAVGELGRFHHGVSHSFLATVLVAGAVAGAFAIRGRASIRILLVVLVLCASHLALDFVTSDPGAPVGMPFLWPWSDQPFQSPWSLLPNVEHTSRPLIGVHNALLMVRETLIFVPLAALVLKARAFPGPWAAAPTWLYAVWFVTAASASVVSLL
jgi:membrane-bound metal-dependent hydrolase YbcI (DUF457 family)